MCLKFAETRQSKQKPETNRVYLGILTRWPAFWCFTVQSVCVAGAAVFVK